MLPPLHMPLPLPTNSRSSLASSTTREGFRLHRARNWELSTLSREDTRGGAADCGPQPLWTPTHSPTRTRARRWTGKTVQVEGDSSSL